MAKKLILDSDGDRVSIDLQSVQARPPVVVDRHSVAYWAHVDRVVDEADGAHGGDVVAEPGQSDFEAQYAASQRWWDFLRGRRPEGISPEDWDHDLQSWVVAESSSREEGDRYHIR